jgi:ribonuclease PH
MKRSGGRSLGQLRPIAIELDAAPRAEGSALIKCGDTHVLCAASVSEFVPDFAKAQGKGWINAEYSLLPRSTHGRTPRERGARGVKGRTQEIERLIGRALRSVADLRAINGYQITLDCDVLNADGGTRCASVTGAFVALAKAVGWLRGRGKIKASPLKDFVAAVSAGALHGKAFLDLDYKEDARADVDMNIVMTGGGRFVEVQGTAEGTPFEDAELEAMLALGRLGCAQLVLAQKAVLGVENASEC